MAPLFPAQGKVSWLNSLASHASWTTLAIPPHTLSLHLLWNGADPHVANPAGMQVPSYAQQKHKQTALRVHLDIPSHAHANSARHLSKPVGGGKGRALSIGRQRAVISDLCSKPHPEMLVSDNSRGQWQDADLHDIAEAGVLELGPAASLAGDPCVLFRKLRLHPYTKASWGALDSVSILKCSQFSSARQ